MWPVWGGPGGVQTGQSGVWPVWGGPGGGLLTQLYKTRFVWGFLQSNPRFGGPGGGVFDPC